MLAAVKKQFAGSFSKKPFLAALGCLFVVQAGAIAYFGAIGHLPPQPGISTTIALDPTEPMSPLAKNPETGNLQPGDIDLKAAAEAAAKIEEVVAGLHETTPYGMVPIIRASDKLTAFQAYRTAFTPAAETKGLIALVMVNYGMAKPVSDMANDMAGFSYAVSPYLKTAQNWINDARHKGHEIWLDLPLQPADTNKDTGPQTLRTDLSPEDYQKRLLQSLSVGAGYVGAINSAPSSFSTDDFTKLNGALNGRGLAMIDGGNPQLWIDADLSPQAVQAKLDAVEQTALATGKVIVFFHPYPALLKNLQGWSEGLASKSLQIAPLSVVIEKK